MGNADDTSWHLDKRVSLATIVALIIQFILLLSGGVWFVSEFKTQIESNSALIAINAVEIEEVNDELDGINVRMGSQAVQLGRIEESITSLKVAVDRLVDALGRQEERNYRSNKE